MCQSWLHFLMHHQQMWLLWVPFHRTTPHPPFGKVLAFRLASPLHPRHTHTLSLADTISSPPLASFAFYPHLIFLPPASTHLFHRFSLNLFHILPGRVISGSSVPRVCIIRNTFHVNLFFGYIPQESNSFEIQLTRMVLQKQDPLFFFSFFFCGHFFFPFGPNLEKNNH